MQCMVPFGHLRTLALSNLTAEELEDFTPGLDNNVSEIVEGHLEALQFSGALGSIVFSEQREVYR